MHKGLLKKLQHNMRIVLAGSRVCKMEENRLVIFIKMLQCRNYSNSRSIGLRIWFAFTSLEGKNWHA